MWEPWESAKGSVRVPQPGWLKQQNFILSVPGGQQSKIRVSPGLALEAMRQLPSRLSPRFWRFAGVIFGLPWLAEASPQPLPSSSFGILHLHVWLQISPFGEDTGHTELGHTPFEYGFMLTGASLQMVKHLPEMRETWIWCWDRKIPWGRAWQPTPVFLPGESYG